MQKLAIITGGNAGLGKQTALALAKRNFDLVLACRNLNKGLSAADEISKRYPRVNVQVHELQLADLDAVLSFSKMISRPWDLLINNAGAKIEKPIKSTKQGFEWHIGVNHLGHFALTHDLWENAALDAKVVSVASIVARKGNLDFEFSAASFDERKQYANSKLMNYVFSTELAKRLQNSQRSSTCAHPGFTRAEPYGNFGIRIAEYFLAQSAKRGARPIIDATTSPNGTYLAPKFLELWGESSSAIRPRVNQSEVEAFWVASEKLTGRKFIPA